MHFFFGLIWTEVTFRSAEKKNVNGTIVSSDVPSGWQRTIIRTYVDRQLVRCPRLQTGYRISWISTYARRVTMLPVSSLSEILRQWEEPQVKSLKTPNITTQPWPMRNPQRRRRTTVLFIFRASREFKFLLRKLLTNCAPWSVASLTLSYEHYAAINHSLWNCASDVPVLVLRTPGHTQYPTRRSHQHRSAQWSEAS